MKISASLLSLLILCFSVSAFGQVHVVYPENSERVVEYGIGMGTAIAITISWSQNKSVMFAVIHGIFGWMYVIFFIITRRNKLHDKA